MNYPNTNYLKNRSDNDLSGIFFNDFNKLHNPLLVIQ